jgi:hypothetical protein
MLRIFSPQNIGRLQPGSNPRFSVPEASRLTTRPPKPLTSTVVILKQKAVLLAMHGSGGEFRNFHKTLIIKNKHYFIRSAANRKVTGSIPDGAIGFFHWHNPFGLTMALWLTQPLTEMSTRNISWG